MSFEYNENNFIKDKCVNKTIEKNGNRRNMYEEK